MGSIICAAGVDVGRDWLDVGVAPSGRSFRAPNAPAGIAAIIARLRRIGVARVVVEAVGPFAARLVRALAQAGIAVGIVDPKRIRALRTAEGGRAKTDKLDALLIARFALLMPDAARPAPSLDALEVRALSTRRRQLVEMIAMEKTRLKQALDQPLADSHRQIIALLRAEREPIEAQLAARLAQGQGANRLALLQTIPGIGPAVAATLLADLPEIGTLDRKAIASLAGLAPHPTQSGTRPPAAHIAGGRPCVRAALYLAALAAARSQHGFKRHYKTMRQAGKPAKVALIAIARKLLVAANTILRDNRPWMPPQP